MWVSRHPLNNSLAIFIHGLTGSRWHTWRSYVDLFQAIATGVWPAQRERPPKNREHLLRSFDIYLFNYETRGVFQKPLEDFVAELKSLIDAHSSTYDTIVLIGHSQGGLLGKLYILKELADGLGQQMRVDRIITLNTPHRGARWFHQLFLYLGYPLRVVSFRRWSTLRQVFDLTSLSRNVRFLRNNWNENAIFSDAARPATPNGRYIKSVSVRTQLDLLVSASSADGFKPDTPVRAGVGTSHTVDTWAVALRVGELLIEHLDPLPIQMELDRIYAAPGPTVRKQQFFADALSVIQAQNPAVPSSFAQQKAAFLVDEFPQAFARRPLRNLDASAAFRTYVKKVLEA